MLADAWLIAAKDLRIERGSRVVLGQVLPFGVLVLILFGFAISPDLTVVGTERRTVLAQVAPGLFWMAMLFAVLSALSRAFAIEAADGNLDALRLAGIDPGGVFLGKALAVLVQVVVLEVAMGAGAFLFYNPPLAAPLNLALAVILATVAITAAGTLYAALASGLRVRETLVPVLLLPVLAPVLLAATQATNAALFDPSAQGWTWTAALGIFASIYVGAGILSFGPIMEES
jgi:heme exporter protein B